MRYTHRVTVWQAIHIHGWATGKHEHRGMLQLHRAWQVKTTQLTDSDAGTQWGYRDGQSAEQTCTQPDNMHTDT